MWFSISAPRGLSTIWFNISPTFRCPCSRPSGQRTPGPPARKTHPVIRRWDAYPFLAKLGKCLRASVRPTKAVSGDTCARSGCFPEGVATPPFVMRRKRDGFLGRSRSGPFTGRASARTGSRSGEPVWGRGVGWKSARKKKAGPDLSDPEAAIKGGGNGPSRCCRLRAHPAITRGAAVPPGLLVLRAGVVAGPEQRFAAGEAGLVRTV
jgi:hypothetical protein